MSFQRLMKLFSMRPSQSRLSFGFPFRTSQSRLLFAKVPIKRGLIMALLVCSPGYCIVRQAMLEQQEQTSQEGQKLDELTERSRKFLENVSGFLESKRVYDAAANGADVEGVDFVNAELFVQKNRQGNKVQTVDELLEVAGIAKPIFDTILRKIVQDNGLDPDLVVTDKHGNIVMLDSEKKIAFTVLTLAPLKSRDRIVEKCEKGDYSKIVDVVRCSVVVFTKEELERVAQCLKRHEKREVGTAENGNSLCLEPSEEKENSQPQPGQYVVVRLKNRFNPPLFNGYRDALYNIVVDCGNGVTHVCEVQLHLADIVANKERSHKFYEYFRTYFSDSGAEKSRMMVLEKIEKAHGAGDIDRMMRTILNGSDLEQLKTLAYLIEDLMGDVKIAVLIRKRILELDENNWKSQIIYANVLCKAGQHSEAEPVLRTLIPQLRQQSDNSYSEPLMAATSSLALLLQAQGKFSEAELLLQEALDGCRKNLGNSHHHTLLAMNNLAALLHDRGKPSEAEPLFREALDEMKQRLGSSHSDTIAAINNFAGFLEDQGQLSEAESLYREALDQMKKLSGISHVDTLSSIHNLAFALRKQGRLSEAECLSREVLKGQRQELGDLHPHTLASIENLAWTLWDQGRLSEAESLFQEALEGRRKQLGSLHPHTLSAINALAWTLREQGRLSEAEPLFREALEGQQRQQLENSYSHTLIAMSNLAALLRDQGKLSEAESLFRGALEGKRQQLGNSDPDTLASINHLAWTLQDQGKLGEAEPLLREVLEERRQQLGDSHPDTLTSTNTLAALLRDQGRLSEAEPLFRRALEGRRQQLGNSHPDTLTSIHNLAALLREQGILSEAEALFREVLAQRDQLGNLHPSTQCSIHNLTELLRAQGKFNEAVPFYREVLDGRRQQFGNSHPQTLISTVDLVCSLLELQAQAQGEAEAQAQGEAEALLLGLHPDILANRAMPHQGRLGEVESALFSEARQQLDSQTHPETTLTAINNRAAILKELDEAETSLRKALQGMRPES